MKARLWQNLFLLNILITSEVSFAEDANKDIRDLKEQNICLLYTSPSPRDMRRSRMPSSA